jgi:hypothetical protein
VTSSSRDREAGQATVEAVALIPLLVALALIVFCALAVGRARELAGHAAGAGAVALLQDADPERAAREAIPGHTTSEARVVVRDRTVTVSIRPRLPLPMLARRLTVSERADAGPEPAG